MHQKLSGLYVCGLVLKRIVRLDKNHAAKQKLIVPLTKKKKIVKQLLKSQYIYKKIRNSKISIIIYQLY